MISLKCQVCHGELVFQEDGTLACPYCGNRFIMSNEEVSAYGKRRREILTCLAFSDREEERAQRLDRVWQRAEPMSFRTASGEPVSVSCLYEGAFKGVRMLTARTSLLMLFPAGQAKDAEAFNERLALLDFPQTDSGRLQAAFPHPGQVIPLEDGQVMLAVSKKESWFPLAMLGALTPEHAAWVVSRLENICCVLEFSHIRHGGIEPENIMVDPWTHEAALLGGWHRAVPGSPQSDLTEMRHMVRRVLGSHYSASPAAFRDFLSGVPAPDAYDDFARWDSVIETGFGGRRFAQMDIDTLLDT